MSATPILDKMFAKCDTDNSGTISKEEFGNLFKAIDKDGSGSVSRDEWVSGLSEMFQGDGKVAAKVFDSIDSDKSGEIDFKEIQALFDKMDADGDGHVTKPEFHAVWSKMA